MGCPGGSGGDRVWGSAFLAPGHTVARFFVALYGIIPDWAVMIIAAVIYIGGVAGSFRLQLEVILDDLKKKDEERKNGGTD